MPDSLNGEPGDELELPGTVPPAASTRWQDWLGRPVPVGPGLAAANAVPTLPSRVRTVAMPVTMATRVLSLAGRRGAYWRAGLTIDPCREWFTRRAVSCSAARGPV